MIRITIEIIRKYVYNILYITYNKATVSAGTPTVECTNSCYSEEELAQMVRKHRPSPGLQSQGRSIFLCS